MISSIMKTKHFISLGASLLKTEVLNAAGQRTKHTSANISLMEKKANRSDYLHLEMEFPNRATDSENFGKVVDLSSVEPDIDDMKLQTDKIKEKVTKRLSVKNKTSEAENKESEKDSTQSEKGKKLNYADEIKNPITLKSVMPDIKSKKALKDRKKIMLEGRRLIYDAIKAGILPQVVFFSRPSDVEKLNLPDSVKLCRVSYKDIRLWSDVVTPQGIMGIFEKPNLNTPRENYKTIPLTVIIDNVRDCGNMGAILRTMSAVGCEKILLTKGCVDIWEQKVLRSAMGAHFHLPPIRLHQMWSDIESEVPEDSKIILADSENPIEKMEIEDASEESASPSLFKTPFDVGQSLPIHRYDTVDYSQQKTVIIFGGETYGLSQEAQEFAVKRGGIKVFIPLSNKIESLNIVSACGILAYEVRRQLQQKMESRSDEDQHSGVSPE